MSKIAPIYSCFDVVASTFPNIKAQKPEMNAISPEMAMRSRFPKVTDKTIIKALVELSNVRFDNDDIAYMNSLGAKLSFASGEDVIDFLSQKETKIKFERTSVKGVFAQYNYRENMIVINDKYRHLTDKADILAISEAILHECGHAVDNDYENSVQEEFNNLALNVLAHKYYLKKYPHIFETSQSLIVKDGVNVYANLFYDNDPDKKALIARLKQKYGYLPVNDDLHPVSQIPQKVKVDKV